jgi:hypothetical protein
MSGWMPISPWKIIPGSGQTVTNAGTGNEDFANAVGPQTDAIAIRLAPATTPYIAMVRIGQAATVALDYPISSTDPPQIIGVSRGQTVHVYFGAAGSAFMVELTH